MSGQVSYLSGLTAEEQVARRYADRGLALCETRWRGPGGEIDLIFRDGTQLVFVEVKKARDHASAAARVTPRQLARIAASAEAYAARMPGGIGTGLRIDVALVDARGRIEVIENAGLH